VLTQITTLSRPRRPDAGRLNAGSARVLARIEPGQVPAALHRDFPQANTSTNRHEPVLATVPLTETDDPFVIGNQRTTLLNRLGNQQPIPWVTIAR
jgi:hypothetical protein